MLEVLTVVQLLQVNHMEPRPLILVGEEWHALMRRSEFTLKQSGYVSDYEGPYWTYATDPVKAAHQLIEL